MEGFSVADVSHNVMDIEFSNILYGNLNTVFKYFEIETKIIASTEEKWLSLKVSCSQGAIFQTY